MCLMINWLVFILIRIILEVFHRGKQYKNYRYMFYLKRPLSDIYTFNFSLTKYCIWNFYASKIKDRERIVFVICYLIWMNLEEWNIIDTKYTSSWCNVLYCGFKNLLIYTCIYIDEDYQFKTLVFGISNDVHSYMCTCTSTLVYVLESFKIKL